MSDKKRSCFLNLSLCMISSFISSPPYCLFNQTHIENYTSESLKSLTMIRINILSGLHISINDELTKLNYLASFLHTGQLQVLDEHYSKKKSICHIASKIPLHTQINPSKVFVIRLKMPFPSQPWISLSFSAMYLDNWDGWALKMGKRQQWLNSMSNSQS